MNLFGPTFLPSRLRLTTYSSLLSDTRPYFLIPRIAELTYNISVSSSGIWPFIRQPTS